MVEVELNFDFVRGLFMCQRVFKEAWSSKSPNEISDKDTFDHHNQNPMFNQSINIASLLSIVRGNVEIPESIEHPEIRMFN